MRIAHTADIHIRGLNRHDEYREVFEALAADCREQGVDHIAIEGDIFHTKTQGITPEYIEFLPWWLKLLADSLPQQDRPTVHARLGNHDGNLMNSSRQDAVTPIIQALGDPRIRLYKTSGTYEFAPGFNWCVFGIFDKSGWSHVKPVPGEINIACYHGAVAGARSETDWEIEDGLTLDFFNAYDFAFLGDIHRTQHLAHRTPSGKPWISYPGTPVQQNYAESTRHCYLLWDIKGRDDFTVVERPLPNPRPFVTVDWQGSVEATLAQDIDVPRGARCRIRGDEHVSQREMTAMSAALIAARAPAEVTFKFDRPTPGAVGLPGADDSDFTKADLRNPDVLVRMLREHHRDLTVTDAEWVEVIRLLTSYLTTIGASEEVVRNVRWSPRHLQFDNMFPYGSGNILNFDSLQGVTGIFGANRSGKSSIVGTLMYALFNTTDRGPIENMHVVNARHPHCYLRFIIQVAGIDYVIERQTVKHESKKGLTSAVTNLNVFRIEQDGSLHDLCGEQRSDTEKVIRSLIGTARDFQLTSLAAQGDIDRFVREGSTQRRHILARFLDIDVIERMHDCARDDARSLKDQIRRSPQVDWLAEESRLVQLLSECDAALASITREHAIADLESDDVRLRLAEHLGFVPITQAQLDAQRARRDDAAGALRKTEARRQELDVEIGVLAASIARLETVKQKHDITTLRTRLDQIRELERRVDSLRHAKASIVADSVRAQRSLLTLEGVPCGDTYPTCRFIKDALVDRARIPDLTVSVAEATECLQSVEETLTATAEEKIHERVKKHEQAVELLAHATADIAGLRAEASRLSERSLGQAEILAREEVALADLVAAQGLDENFAVVVLKTRADELRIRIRELDAEKIAKATTRGRYQVELEKCRVAAAERIRVETQLRVYDLITTAFSKRGIPSTIVNAELPVINAVIAQILHGIVDFTVELASQDEGNALDVYINYGDSRRLLELGSGMEKFVSSLAIRVALTTVSSLPKTDIFIIDEGFGSLDDAGIEACGRLLQSLKRYFRDVLVITHVDGIKDVADNVIEITKIEKDSMVLVP